MRSNQNNRPEEDRRLYMVGYPNLGLRFCPQSAQYTAHFISIPVKRQGEVCKVAWGAKS